jgi:hypothetical protein
MFYNINLRKIHKKTVLKLRKESSKSFKTASHGMEEFIIRCTFEITK